MAFIDVLPIVTQFCVSAFVLDKAQSKAGDPMHNLTVLHLILYRKRNSFRNIHVQRYHIIEDCEVVRLILPKVQWWLEMRCR